MRPFSRFRGFVISDAFFFCTRFAQKSPSRTPRRTGQACPLSRASLLQAGFARRKKKNMARKDAKPPRPPEVIPMSHYFFAALRLCAKKK
jgi:hypothetical protein